MARTPQRTPASGVTRQGRHRGRHHRDRRLMAGAADHLRVGHRRSPPARRDHGGVGPPVACLHRRWLPLLHLRRPAGRPEYGRGRGLLRGRLGRSDDGHHRRRGRAVAPPRHRAQSGPLPARATWAGGGMCSAGSSPCSTRTRYSTLASSGCHHLSARRPGPEPKGESSASWSSTWARAACAPPSCGPTPRSSTSTAGPSPR